MDWTILIAAVGVVLFMVLILGAYIQSYTNS